MCRTFQNNKFASSSESLHKAHLLQYKSQNSLNTEEYI